MNEDMVQGVPTDDPIIAEAKKRWTRCADWEANARERFIDDVKFENGDSDNGYQWPDAIRRSRDVDNRPCLTMNIIRQHNLQISNQARKNKTSPKVVATGNGATQDSADVLRDIFRHIEIESKAQSVYTLARGFQIGGGIGWWRLSTAYADEESFDQKIIILPVNDPLSVYMDPDIKQKDGSDARFAFVFDDVPKDSWDEQYPEYKDQIGDMPLGIGAGDDWLSKDHIKICEYFRKVMTGDKVVSFMVDGVRKSILLSKLPEDAKQPVLSHYLTKVRETQTEVIEWYLIAGSKVIDKTVWVGKYIPLIRVIGEEVVIEGVMDRKGHTRTMKDGQRMYNYNSSAQVEFVALQGKSPWVAPAKAIEEYESMWNTANLVNHSVLIYNHMDDDGNEIPPPQRTQPPSASPAFQVGMDTAFNQIMMVSGQWQNQMGMQGNERTGKAIGLRQEQSDTAVFHFQDNYEEALQYTAKQILDLFPKIYDTKRTLQIMAENGETIELQLDPGAKQAFAVQQARDGAAVQRVLNPKIGNYDVAPSSGPAYGSKREQTVEALTLIITQSPALVPIVGDLLLGSMDFDKAQEAAQRLRRMVPPQALGTGPTQNEQQLQLKVAGLTNALAESLKKQGKNELKLVGKEQLRDVDVYKAHTDRMTALGDFLPTDPDGLRSMIYQLVNEALETSLKPIIDANADNLDIDGQGPSPNSSADHPVLPRGAKRAPDGHHYLEDPQRPGKYLKVEPA